MAERNDPINPEMLTIARESRGFTQAELSARAQVTQGQISKIESGAAQPSAEVLSALAHALAYPESFFRQNGRMYGPSISEFFHRKKASVSVRALDKIHAQINIRRLQIGHLLRSWELEEKMPRFDVEDFGGDPEEVARAVRAQWGLPRGPVKDVVGVIEDAGGVVIRLRFDTNLVDAVSWWVPGGPPLFIVNDTLPADRERLSLVHELGHVVMHDSIRPDMEGEANRFAAAFLMPAEDIRSQLDHVSMHSLAGLKGHWRVSMQALLKRAEDLGLITAGQARYHWIQMGRAGYRTREPAELDFPKEEPSTLQDLVDVHCDELGYTLGDLSQLLHWEPREVVQNYQVKSSAFAPEDKPRLRVMKSR
jgi:Zn-dependent peptidase ImmA (M78 family)/transcriptional regulator with XRE-family HTH domain